jgi:hypothetical protein
MVSGFINVGEWLNCKSSVSESVLEGNLLIFQNFGNVVDFIHVQEEFGFELAFVQVGDFLGDFFYHFEVLLKDESDVGFAFGFFTHDFDPAFATVFEKPLLTAWSLLDNVEGFFVGDVFESLDFVDDFGLEFLGEVLESLRD